MITLEIIPNVSPAGQIRIVSLYAPYKVQRLSHEKD